MIRVDSHGGKERESQSIHTGGLPWRERESIHTGGLPSRESDTAFIRVGAYRESLTHRLYGWAPIERVVDTELT